MPIYFVASGMFGIWKSYVYLRNRVFFGGTVGGLIVGLDLAVSSMKKGELARVIIRPQYAFGEMGTPPRIPKDATGKKSVF